LRYLKSFSRIFGGADNLYAPTPRADEQIKDVVRCGVEILGDLPSTPVQLVNALTACSRQQKRSGLHLGEVGCKRAVDRATGVP
jgi:hypothetical protein